MIALICSERLETAGPWRVGEAWASKPWPPIMFVARSEWFGSVTTATDSQPFSSATGAKASAEPRVSIPSPMDVIASSGTPLSRRY